MTAAGPATIEVPAPSAAPASARETAYIPTLDGWRAIAILLVLVHHVTPSIYHAWGRGFGGAVLRTLYERGAVGVSIFFGISGLLICTRLLEEYRRRDRIDLATFYIRRAYRILPPSLVYLTVLALL